MARRRLDAELVRRKMARSREHASQLIAAGRVTVAVATATKSATQVETSAALVVRADDSDPDYVSRGGHKLAGALAAFTPLGLEVAGRRALDAGASTGGFTDVRLRAENARLRRALAGRPVIDQARGILMATEGCTAERAWDILRQTSQHANLKVREVAGEVVADPTGTVPPGPVRTHLREAVRQHRAARRKAS